MLTQANRTGRLRKDFWHNQERIIETGGFVDSARDLGNVVVGLFVGRAVYLREVVHITDGSAEPSQYVFFGSGQRFGFGRGAACGHAERPQTNGANSMPGAKEVLKKVKALKGRSHAVQPSSDNAPAMKWVGEWHITIEVFRDLGNVS